MRPVDLVAFMENLAAKSGAATLPFFRSQFALADKAGMGGFDPVTEADRAAELVIRHEIGAIFPAHGIIGEEFGDDGRNCEYTWIIDPIDGTRSFICGIPLWGTLIGLTRHGAPVMGMMHQPYIGETFMGDCDKAWVNGPSGKHTLKTRGCSNLADAFLMTTSPSLFGGAEAEVYKNVERQVRLARYGTDCYAYAMLAAGQIDLVIESGLKPYDIVALIPIIEGAGGVITSWDGGSAANGGQVVAAGTRQLHEKALKLLAQGVE